MIPLFNQQKTFDLLREAFYCPHKAFFNRNSHKINSSYKKTTRFSRMHFTKYWKEKVERQGKCYVHNTRHSDPIFQRSSIRVSIEQILEPIKAFFKKHFPFHIDKNFPFKSRHTGDVFFTSFTFPSNFRDKRQSSNESCVYNQLKIPSCGRQTQFYRPHNTFSTFNWRFPRESSAIEEPRGARSRGGWNNNRLLTRVVVPLNATVQPRDLIMTVFHRFDARWINSLSPSISSNLPFLLRKEARETINDEEEEEEGAKRKDEKSNERKRTSAGGGEGGDRWRKKVALWTGRRKREAPTDLSLRYLSSPRNRCNIFRVQSVVVVRWMDVFT